MPDSRTRKRRVEAAVRFLSLRGAAMPAVGGWGGWGGEAEAAVRARG